MSKDSSKVRSIADYRQRRNACRRCDLFCMCFPGTVADGWRHLESLKLRRRSLCRGEHLAMAGDALRGLFVLRSGSLKAYELSADGDALVTGFFVPGEVVGLSAMNGDTHTSYVMALEDIDYCEIPVLVFRRLQDRNAEVRRHTERLFSRNLALVERQLVIIRHLDAQARVSVFLIDLAARITGAGQSGKEFRLGMARHDIADYLGLTIGTVSRNISGLQKAGILVARGKNIRIIDPQALLNLTDAGRTLNRHVAS